MITPSLKVKVLQSKETWYTNLLHRNVPIQCHIKNTSQQARPMQSRYHACIYIYIYTHTHVPIYIYIFVNCCVPCPYTRFPRSNKPYLKVIGGIRLVESIHSIGGWVKVVNADYLTSLSLMGFCTICTCIE